MYKALDVMARMAALIKEGASGPDMIRELSGMTMGWLYVFGASRNYCAVDVRERFAGLRPDHRAAIYAACPVLSGKKVACADCAYDGTLVNDCRGFTRGLLAWAGLQLYGDTVTTQWETASNWAIKGPISDMPRGLVCVVFRTGHTGMHLGNGRVRHCGGKKGCVQEEELPGNPKWLKYGIPAGLYTDEELRKAGVIVDPWKNVPTVRKGASGELVKYLQMDLNEEMGSNLAVDGVFGAKTEEALKAFQRAHGLTSDGICGPKTWAALESCEDRPSAPEGGGEAPEASPAAEPSAPAPEPEPDPAEPEKPPGDGVTLSRDDWNAVKAAAAVLIAAVKKYE